MPIVPTVQGRQVESRGVQTGGFQTFNQPNITDALVNIGNQAIGVFGQAKQQGKVRISRSCLPKLTR